MNKIIPSTRLKVISIHKLYDTSCWRYYFWSHVLNLSPKNINFNFWYGGVLHMGFETLLLTKKLVKALAAMKKESKRRLAGYTLSGDDEDEMSIQYEIIKTLITEVSKQRFMRHLHLDWAEKQIKTPLAGRNSDILFCTTMDGQGGVKDTPCNFEIKTASRIYDVFFKALKIDKQIHSHAWSLKKNNMNSPARCAYCIFRKPQKKIKRNQTVDQFIQEVKQDIQEKPNYYFGGDESRVTFPYMQRLGSNTIRNTGKNLNAFATMLKKMYDVRESLLLDPFYWPENDRQCLNYGQCTYLLLCTHMQKWELYMRTFTQREMLYSEEELELQ